MQNAVKVEMIFSKYTILALTLMRLFYILEVDNICKTVIFYMMDNKEDKNILKYYHGRIPACGVFCGGCPTYTREKKPCPGAEINKARCEKCKTFHLCCQEKGVSHCHECDVFPCQKFKSFSNRWLKYGQNFIENQKLLKEQGEQNFLFHYNSKIGDANIEKKND